MVQHELHTLGAVNTAALIARGEISALAVTEVRIAVIEQHNPRLNAIVARRYGAARAEPRAVDRAQACGQILGPLAGVPVTVKEAIDVAGLASTSGAPARAGHLADADDPAVARLRAAGAIVLGKTNVAQGLVFAETDNPLFGRCNHPHDDERSPGGSSGGEGAILAVGGAALGLGTDIGGSGRIPAAFCGIASLKRTLSGGAIDARVKQLMIVAGLPAWLRHAVAALARAAGQRHLPALLRALGPLSADGYWQRVEEQQDYQLKFAAAMDQPAGGGAPLDLLLSPVVPVPAFRHRATLDLGVPGIYTSLYNLLGWPAGVVPWGQVRPGEESMREAGKDLAERAAAATETGSAGLPLAVQVAARPWCEHQALAAMRVIEAQARAR